MCLNSLNQLILRGRLNGAWCLQLRERERGKITHQFYSECQHFSARASVLPENPNCVLEACAECGVIRAYYLLERLIRNAYENILPHDICRGPKDTLLVMTQDNKLLQLQWNRLHDKLMLLKQDGHFHINAEEVRRMHYIEQDDLLVLTSLGGHSSIHRMAHNPLCCIKAMRLGTKTHVWEFSEVVEGKTINPHGMCSDKAGHLYVADGSNDRLLVMDRSTGQLLMVLLQEQEKIVLHR